MGLARRHRGPRVGRARVGPGLALATALLGAACGQEGDSAPVGAMALDDVAISSTRWTFQWPAAGPITTDLGYDIEIDRFWVILHSIALSPCEEAVAGTLLVGHARAAHGGVEEQSQLVLSLAGGPGSPWTFDGHSFEPQGYCGLWWMLARAEGGTAALDGEAADGRSLVAEGRWTQGKDSGSFHVETSLTDARIVPWDAVARRAGTGEGHLVIQGRTASERLFDEIDWRTVSDESLAWALLEGVLEQTTFEVGLE